MIERIFSGGQTGVDRAALDVAMAEGLACGGSCPAGRQADDGPIPEKYPLQEITDRDHLVRTENNVRDSDGSLLLYRDSIHGGTAYAEEMCKHLNKPVMLVDLNNPPAITVIVDWFKKNQLHVLHIGGQREKTSPGIYKQASVFIMDVLTAA